LRQQTLFLFHSSPFVTFILPDELLIRHNSPPKEQPQDVMLIRTMLVWVSRVEPLEQILTVCDVLGRFPYLFVNMVATPFHDVVQLTMTFL